MMDWQKVVSRHSGLVWKTAYRLLANHADAADCVQDTFISALEVSRRGRVRHWEGLLCRLATTRALDRLRQRLRQAKFQHSSADWMNVPSQNPGPVQQAQDRELGNQLRRALTQIPPQQAEVFCLRCLDEMSYREIARQLGVTSNAVGILLHRARLNLREQLASVMPETES